jgi:exosome complex component RRP46
MPIKSVAPVAPEAALSVLSRADGSAKYSYAGYTVTASVTGPIEAQRRDEHIYEAHVNVIVRPAAGVGGERLGIEPPETSLLTFSTV